MVPISNGNSEIVTHVRSNLGLFDLYKALENSHKLNLFSLEKVQHVLQQGVPSNISTMALTMH